MSHHDDAPASLQKTPRRRWWQFSLRAVLLVVVPVACGLALAGRFVQSQMAVAAAETEIRRLGGYISKGQVSGTFSIDLSGCQVDDAQLAELAHLLSQFPGPAIDYNHDMQLALNGTQITDSGLEHLRGLPIIRLELADTAITDDSLPLISEFELWSLGLQNTAVTDLEPIARLRLLRLDIRGTQVTPAQVQELKAAMPRCEIYYDP